MLDQDSAPKRLETADAVFPVCNLRTWLSSKPPLSERLRVFHELCDQVARAHERGWIHGSIAPELVRLGAVAEVSLGGWIPEDESAEAREPRAFGGVEGEGGLEGHVHVVSAMAAFLAPERIRFPERAASVATDIYALGGLLYFLLTGQAPVKSAEPAGLRDAVLRHEVAAPSSLTEFELPARLELELMRALALDPDERPVSVRAFSANLSELQPAPVLARMESGSSWPLAINVSAAIIAILVAGFFVWTGREQSLAAEVREREARAELERAQKLLNESRTQSSAARERLAAAQRLEDSVRADRASLEQARVELDGRFEVAQEAEALRAQVAELEAKLSERRDDSKVRVGEDPKLSGPGAVPFTDEAIANLQSQAQSLRRRLSFFRARQLAEESRHAEARANLEALLGVEARAALQAALDFALWSVGRSCPAPVWESIPGRSFEPLIVLSADRQLAYLASGSQLFTLDLDGAQLAPFSRELPGKVTAIALNDARGVLAVGTSDGNLALLKSRSGEPVAEVLRAHGQAIVGLAWDDFGELVSASSDIALWSAELQALARRRPESDKAPLLKALAVCKRKLWTLESNGRLWTWDLSPGGMTPLQARATSGLRALSPSPEGQRLALIGDEGLSLLLDDGSLRSLRVQHAGGPQAVVWIGEERIMSLGADQRLVLRSLATERVLFESAVQRAPIIALAATSEAALSLSEAGGLALWSLVPDPADTRLAGLSERAETVALSPDGEIIASGDSRGRVALRDRLTSYPLQGLDFGGPLRSLKFSRDGARLGGLRSDGLLKIWSLREASFQRELPGVTDFCSLAESFLLLSPGHYKIDALREDRPAQVPWSLRAELVLCESEPNELVIIAGPQVQRWRLAPAELLASAELCGRVSRAALSRDDRRLLVTLDDQQVQVLDGSSLNVLRTLPRQAQRVVGAWPLLGSHAALVLDGLGELRLWDLDEGEDLWRERVSGPGSAPPLECRLEGSVFLVSLGRELRIMDWAATPRRRALASRLSDSEPGSSAERRFQLARIWAELGHWARADRLLASGDANSAISVLELRACLESRGVEAARGAARRLSDTEPGLSAALFRSALKTSR